MARLRCSTSAEIAIQGKLIHFIYGKVDERIIKYNQVEEEKLIKEEKLYVLSYIGTVISMGCNIPEYLYCFPKCIHPPLVDWTGYTPEIEILTSQQYLLDKINKNNAKAIQLIKERITFNMLI